MAPGIESQPSSIPNYGKAANVGQVDIKDQTNNFAPGANEVSVDKSRRKSTRIKKIQHYHRTYNTTYQLRSSPDPRPVTPTLHRPGPGQDAARHVQLYSEPPVPRDYPWSYAFGGFAPAEEDARLQVEIQHRWAQTDKSVRKLNRAVSAFRPSRDDSSSDSDGVDDDSGLDPSSGASAFRAELQDAIQFYNRGTKKQSPVLGALRDIKANMGPFLSWTAALPGNRHRLSVLSATKSIIEAFQETDRPDDDVAETIANTVRAFGTDLEDYLSAMRMRRLTVAMETDTIDIFEKLVLILVSILENGRRTLRSTKKGVLDDDISSLEETLSSVKNKVKKSQQEQMPIYPRLPVDLGPRPDKYGLVIAYHGFFQSLRPPYEVPEPGPPRLTRRSSMMQNDTGSSSSIQAETIIRYVEYDALERTSEMDLCLQRSKPNPSDMQKLAALTQRRDYQAWLTKDARDSALLIHGRFTSRGLVSPLSYLCARIVEKYAGDQKVAVISYFCGHRKLTNKKLAVGPPDLMCQLIGQLLSHPVVAAAYKRHPIFERNWEKKIKSKQTKDLMSAFSKLVRRLLRHHCDQLVVFCLIDAISEMETGRGIQKDMESVLVGLRDIVKQQQTQTQRRKEGGGRKNARPKVAGSRMLFKLLVTAPATSLTAYKYFNLEDTIDLASRGLGSSVPQLSM